MTFFSKLNGKFISSSIAVLAIIMATISFYSIENQKEALQSYTETLGNSIAETVANFSLEPLLIRDYPILAAFVERLVQRDENIAYIQVFRDNGQLITESKLNAKNVLDEKYYSVYSKEIAVTNFDKPIGKVVVAISTIRLVKLVNTRIYESIGVSTLSFFLLSGIIYFLMKNIVTDRLARLATWASRLGQGRLDDVESILGGDEISDLARSFDEMRANLKQSYDKILTQNAELIRLGRAKDEFLSNMSHELRTPLNAIIGYSEIIIEDANFGGDASAGDHATKVLCAGGHLLNIVNDLLDLSRLESGKVGLRQEQLSLTALISEVINVIRPNLRGNTLRLANTLSQDYVMVDGQKLKQILINLLSNACKFTERGEIHLKIYEIMQAAERRLCFSVEDTGIGISESDIGSLFEAFFQADLSHTKQYGGTGLGLTISKRLADLLGGKIEIFSVKNQGSRFTLMIPYANEDLVAQESLQLQAG